MHNTLRDMCTFTCILWYTLTRFTHPYIIAHRMWCGACVVQVYEVSHRIFFRISFSIRIRYWFSLSFSYWECYLVLLIIFHRRGRDEDFIVRTPELLTFIITPRPTFSTSWVPLIKLSHWSPIRCGSGLYCVHGQFSNNQWEILFSFSNQSDSWFFHRWSVDTYWWCVEWI